MSKDNGGPAFPTDSERQIGSTTWHMEGMTLRDYFAAKAMQAELLAAMQNGIKFKDDDMQKIAASSYYVADAMLAERAKC